MEDKTTEGFRGKTVKTRFDKKEKKTQHVCCEETPPPLHLCRSLCQLKQGAGRLVKGLLSGTLSYNTTGFLLSCLSTSLKL